MMSGNQLYPNGKKHLWAGNINVEDSSGAGQLYAALVSSGYSPSYSHEFFNQVSNQIGSSVALTSADLDVNTTTGVVKLDADDVTFSSVAVGSTIDAIIVYAYGSAGSTDYLLAYFDNDGSAISLTTNGGDITVSWNSSGIAAV